jgi:hypothetical protein
MASSMRQLLFGLASIVLVAACSSFFWYAGIHNEPGLTALPTPNTPVADERVATRNGQAANMQMGWGFTDRWFPLIQVMPPSPPAAGRHAIDSSSVVSEPSTTEEVADVRAETVLIPLPRRRPLLAKETRVPLPRPRPNDSAPQSVFVAMGTSLSESVDALTRAIIEPSRITSNRR